MKTNKEKKLAEALRNNLLKRKQQKREAGENADRFRKKNIGISTLLSNDSKLKNEKKD